MFPFVRLCKRPWFGPLFLATSLFLSSATTVFLNQPASQAPTTDVEYLSFMEGHLSSKAREVVARTTAEPFTVDLSIELETAQTTVTTFVPDTSATSSSEPAGRWEESTDVRPTIKAIRCCVTLAHGQTIDHDHLYRCLSYSLGIDLRRGDLLQIVEL